MRDAALGSSAVLVYVPAVVEWVGAMQRTARGRSDTRLATLEIGEAVGLAIAHEIGHVLSLRHNRRSAIMKAQFDADDVVALRSAQLRFDRLEGCAMRGSLLTPSQATQRARTVSGIADPGAACRVGDRP